MSTRAATVLVTLAVGLPAFMLSRVIWPPAPGNPAPTDEQLPFFILLSLIESLLFGLGIAFVAFGLPVVRRAARTAGVAAGPTYVAIAWQLVSWWPHDNFHMAVGMDMGGLLLIEYGFHVTLIVSALVVARFFLATLRSASASPASARAG